jgi:TorA maturation chaperone TorD
MHLTLSGLQARRASYDLLARLYLEELDADLVAYLRGLPPFAEHLPSDAEAEAWLAEGAVEYQRLFGMNVYPYESIFIDRELMLNTAATDHVALLYRICDFDSPVVRVGAPDHLGLELRLMRDLIAAELHAYERGDADGMHWARTQQARCLHARSSLTPPTRRPRHRPMIAIWTRSRQLPYVRTVAVHMKMRTVSMLSCAICLRPPRSGCC